MIRYWDYSAEFELDRPGLLAATERVFASGRLILGDEVAAFEREFSEYCGTGYGVGVNSGTDALFLALKALGVGNGDEVITVSNTAVPTVAAIRASGATPVFVDVEEDTCLMDIDLVRQAVTERTKCIMPVHLFGQPVDMAPLLELAAERTLSVIEDCAQAAGALYNGRKVGSLGDIGAFSFYPTKILGAFGDGGMAVTGEAAMYEKLRRLRFYGMEKAYYSEEEGYNSRLDELQAALLRLKLKGIGEAVRRRREIAAKYGEGLTGVGDLRLPVTRGDRTHQFYTYTVRTEYRDPLMSFLGGRGIETRINYPVPVHLMRGYSFLGYRRGDLPVTERLADEILSLPMFPSLSHEAAAGVIRAVRAFFSTHARRE